MVCDVLRLFYMLVEILRFLFWIVLHVFQAVHNSEILLDTCIYARENNNIRKQRRKFCQKISWDEERSEGLLYTNEWDFGDFEKSSWLNK